MLPLLRQQPLLRRLAAQLGRSSGAALFLGLQPSLTELGVRLGFLGDVGRFERLEVDALLLERRDQRRRFLLLAVQGGSLVGEIVDQLLQTVDVAFTGVDGHQAQRRTLFGLAVGGGVGEDGAEARASRQR